MTKQINNRNDSFIYKLIVATIVLLLMFVAAILFGAANTSMKDIWLALMTNESNEAISVIRDIRLPREIAAVFVGAALAVSGAIMQGMTRNPLADPGLLGLTAGANAMLAITVAFFPSINYFGIMIACFIGALIGTIMVFSIGAIKKGGLSPFRIVLAGAAVSAFLYAIEQGIGIYFKVSKDVSMWTAGGLIGTTWTQLKMMVPFIVLGIFIAMILSRQLTILSLNEEVAIGLGQKIAIIKTTLFVVIITLAGTAVALVGNIAFIGLMIPHIVRAIVGTDYRYIIPMSAIIGATFMLFADTIARTINAPYETPIIAVVAILGLPFFLFIVRKGGKAFI
ncbi:FecCD family ABC transporter permease [Pseudogracilibacillus auburnensis]|uniref:Iron complex transport system permease protein n=1 Tax=Pseudogracilibacillus auburnensis TaxID=1494959 RepID=A0A2V3VP25_9BACI|nr:iron ABC transporter permease [Pseudogracilibacillus auburnensis]PXW83566.1 iron complex transport system permease protein [Pseudogracilibacillus auburnensis]